MSEKEIEKEILSWLNSHPRVVRAWSNDQDRTRMRKYTRGNKKKSVSDIIGFFDTGNIFAIEVKDAGNKPSKGQTEFLEDVSKTGSLSLAAWSLEDVQAAVAKHIF